MFLVDIRMVFWGGCFSWYPAHYGMVKRGRLYLHFLDLHFGPVAAAAAGVGAGAGGLALALAGIFTGILLF